MCLFRQVGRCALRVPAPCPFIPNPRHPSIASPAVTCFADPACIRNHSKWTLPVYQRPITSGVLPAAALPRAVASCVCIGDLWAQERKKHVVPFCGACTARHAVMICSRSVEVQPCYLGVNPVTDECAHSIHTNETKDKTVQVQARLCINSNVYILHVTPF